MPTNQHVQIILIVTYVRASSYTIMYIYVHCCTIIHSSMQLGLHFKMLAFLAFIHASIHTYTYTLIRKSIGLHTCIYSCFDKSGLGVSLNSYL